MNTRGHAKMSNDRTTPLLFDFAESDSADKTTNYLKLTPGDFLKNAGNVGFLRLWEFICRDRGEEFEVVDEIPIEKLPDEKKLAQYIMDMYISEYSGDSKVQRAFDKLDGFVELIDSGHLPNGSSVNEESIDSFININELKLLKGFKCDFDGIKDQVNYVESYVEFLEKKAPKGAELIEIVRNIKKFCDQKIVKRAFLFRDAARNVIDPFLQNKSFFDYSNNARKNAEKLIEKDFTHPFIQCLKQSAKPENGIRLSKNASNCIACSNIIAKKSDRQPMSFIKDAVDDLEYKSSLFWNFNPDAHLCPVCTLIYLLAPLGFRRINSGDFIFINSNESFEMLWNNNTKKIDDSEKRKEHIEAGEDADDLENDNEAILRRVDAALLNMLDDKSKILSNVQTIVRTKQKNTKGFMYQFSVFDRDLLYLIHKEQFPNLKAPFPTIRQNLAKLAIRKPFMTSNGSYFNVYRHCLDNVLTYQNQYNLLFTLVLESLKEKKSWINVFLAPVFRIQCLQTYHAFKEKEKESMKNVSDLQFHASKAGAAMRSKLVIDAVGSENIPSERQEDIVRNVVYRLANALKTNNVEQFIDVLIRLYASSKEPIPTVFMTALRNETIFPLIGYAYILGLKGAFYQRRVDDSESAV